MTQPTKSLFATRLLTLRKKFGLSQDALSDVTDCAQSTVGDWESDKPKSSPSALQIVAMCKLFGVTSDYLLGLADTTHGLWPDQCIVNEGNEALAREKKPHGWVVLKVPRRLRIVDHAEGLRLAKELGLKPGGFA